MKRAERYLISLTGDEKTTWQQAAAARDVSLATMIRHAVAAYIDQPGTENRAERHPAPADALRPAAPTTRRAFRGPVTKEQSTR